MVGDQSRRERRRVVRCLHHLPRSLAQSRQYLLRSGLMSPRVTLAVDQLRRGKRRAVRRLHRLHRLPRSLRDRQLIDSVSEWHREHRGRVA